MKKYKSKLPALIIVIFYLVIVYFRESSIPAVPVSIFGLIVIWGADIAAGHNTTIPGFQVTIPSASSIRFVGWVLVLLPLILYLFKIL
jgi:hypothetical protein